MNDKHGPGAALSISTKWTVARFIDRLLIPSLLLVYQSHGDHKIKFTRLITLCADLLQRNTKPTLTSSTNNKITLSQLVVQFLSRDAAMLARSWGGNSICLSVRLSVSVTCMFCDKTDLPLKIAELAWSLCNSWVTSFCMPGTPTSSSAITEKPRDACENVSSRSIWG